MAGMIASLLGSAGRAGGEILGRQNALDEQTAALNQRTQLQHELEMRKQAFLQDFQSKQQTQQQEFQSDQQTERIVHEDERAKATTDAADRRHKEVSGDTQARIDAEERMSKFRLDGAGKDVPASVKLFVDTLRSQTDDIRKQISSETDPERRKQLEAELRKKDGAIMDALSRVGAKGGERGQIDDPLAPASEKVTVKPDASGKWEAKEGTPEFEAIRAAVMKSGSAADKELVGGKPKPEPQAKGMIGRLLGRAIPMEPEFERYYAMDEGTLEKIAASDKDESRREKAKAELARRRRDFSEGANRLNELPLY